MQVIVVYAVLTIHDDCSFCPLLSTYTGVISSVVQTEVRNLHLHKQVLLPHLVFVSISQQLLSSPPLHRRGRFVELTAQNRTVALRHLLVDEWQLKTWWQTCQSEKILHKWQTAAFIQHFHPKR